eukprot:m.45178 g.45178  ORF g.45178 m.45178 type:complete len:614 (+) comp33571_c0_seq5:683-2524(+)
MSVFREQMLFFGNLRTFLPSAIHYLKLRLGSFQSIEIGLPSYSQLIDTKEVANIRENKGSKFQDRKPACALSKKFDLVDNIDNHMNKVKAKVNDIKKTNCLAETGKGRKFCSNLFFERVLKESTQLSQQFTQQIENGVNRSKWNVICDVIVPSFQQLRKGFQERRQSSILSQVVTVPSEFIGTVIGKGGKHLRRFRQLSGARITFISEEERFHIKGSEESNKRAIREFYNRIANTKRFNSIVQTGAGPRLFKSVIVGRESSASSSEYVLKKADQTTGKFNYRLSDPTSSFIPHQMQRNGRTRGADEMLEDVKLFLDEIKEGRRYKIPLIDVQIDAWYHLGQVIFQRLQVQELQGSGSVEIPNLPRYFSAGLPVNISGFSCLESFLKRRSQFELCENFVRHDLTIFTPSFNVRRFIVRIPSFSSDMEEDSAASFHYPAVQFCRSSSYQNACFGRLLGVRMEPDLKIDILMPDLPWDCRLLLRRGILSSTPEEEEEDKILLTQFCDKVKVIGNHLILPKMPENYMLDFHRMSKRTLYRQSDYDISISIEEELESGQTLLTTGRAEKVDVHVKNRKIEKLFHSREAGAWSSRKIKEEIEESFHFIRKLSGIIGPDV